MSLPPERLAVLRFIEENSGTASENVLLEHGVDVSMARQLVQTGHLSSSVIELAGETAASAAEARIPQQPVVTYTLTVLGRVELEHS